MFEAFSSLFGGASVGSGEDGVVDHVQEAVDADLAAEHLAASHLEANLTILTDPSVDQDTKDLVLSFLGDDLASNLGQIVDDTWFE